MSTATFTDNAGREWRLALSFNKLRYIRKRTGLDLGETERIAEVWAKILASDNTALEVIWTTLADCTAGVTEEDWLDAMDGSRLEEAREALLQAVINFTQPQKQDMVREGATMVMERYKDAVRQAVSAIRSVTDTTTKSALAQLGIAPPTARV